MEYIPEQHLPGPETSTNGWLYRAGPASDVRLPRLALSRTALLGGERAGAEAEAAAAAAAEEEAAEESGGASGTHLTRVHVLCSPTCSGENPVLSSRAACSTVDTSGALPDAGLYVGLLRRSAALPAPAAAAPRDQDILPLRYSCDFSRKGNGVHFTTQ